MQPHISPSSPLPDAAVPAAAKANHHCAAAVLGYQRHVRSVLPDCLLRFYAFVSREHAAEQSSLDAAIMQASAPDFDNFDSFVEWSVTQENCCVAVGCSVAHMLRRLQAAGHCPGLSKTLEAAAAGDVAVPAPLRSLLDGVRSRGPAQ